MRATADCGSRWRWKRHTVATVSHKTVTNTRVRYRLVPPPPPPTICFRQSCTFGDPKPSSDLNLSALVVFVHTSAKRIFSCCTCMPKCTEGTRFPLLLQVSSSSALFPGYIGTNKLSLTFFLSLFWRKVGLRLFEIVSDAHGPSFHSYRSASRTLCQHCVVIGTSSNKCLLLWQGCMLYQHCPVQCTRSLNCRCLVG